MITRSFALILLLLVGCKSDLINCPDYKPLKLRHSNPFSIRTKRPDVVTASSNTYNSREFHRIRTKEDPKKSMDIEEWDCPRPGEQKNSKIVKEAVKRMERRQREETKRRATDTLANPQVAHH